MFDGATSLTDEQANACKKDAYHISRYMEYLQKQKRFPEYFTMKTKVSDIDD